jgi:pimeloyl-ACP methyl ester carboxylesterase
MTTAYLLLRIIVVACACLYIGVCVFLYFYQARFLFPGAFMPFPTELQNLGPNGGFESVTIPTRDNEKLFALERAPADGNPIVIIFHGNASYPEAYGFLYAGWIGAGYGIIAPAARGYPRSTGKADGGGMLADAIDIYDWAVKSHPGHPVYAVGQSLGTAAAVHLAAHRPVAGVVLISPFKSMLSLVQSKIPCLPISWLLSSPFRSDLDIPAIKAPILITHGEQDVLVPIASARALAALAKTSVQFKVIRNAGHAVGLFQPDMIEAIDTFLGQSTQ